MAPRVKKQVRDKNKPILIQCGDHFINPKDVRLISRVKNPRDGRKDLYIVKFLSDPNPEFPCWVKGDDIAYLLEHFEIVTSD